jgi:hypothetical protein
MEDTIFSVTQDNFNSTALEVFRFQFAHNPVYRTYVQHLNINPETIQKVEDIPFLPVEVFKNHAVITRAAEPEIVFKSSATTGLVPSRHLVKNKAVYECSVLTAFRRFYGDPAQYTFLALLPHYLERGNSSLVYMVNYLMQQNPDNPHGFYLHNHAELRDTIKKQTKEGRKIFLIGVAYALADLAEQFPVSLEGQIVMETGGMKGRKKELLRQQLHVILRSSFHVDHIHSEYGMTELLSQAYARQDGRFECPPWMRVLLREVNDPFAPVETGQSGLINIIDLANINSCSFLATQDLGRQFEDGRFEVLGRADNSDVRGCSLLYFG